jgi:hypothetical protein
MDLPHYHGVGVVVPAQHPGVGSGGSPGSPADPGAAGGAVKEVTGA